MSDTTEPTRALTEMMLPQERFISGVVEPQRDSLHIWPKPLTHSKVLVKDLKARRRVTFTSVAGPNAAPGGSLAKAGQRIGGIDGWFTTLVSHQARRVTGNRQLLRQYMRASGVNFIPGKAFLPSQASAATDYATALSPLVSIRPNSRIVGGATAEALDPTTQFSSTWNSVVEATADRTPGEHQVEVAPCVQGLRLRFFVVGERAVGALVRVPLYVVGDGSTTTGELLEAELNRRAASTTLRAPQPEAQWDLLSSIRVTNESVLPHGQVQLLQLAPSEAARGNITVDVLEEISNSLANKAVDAMWALPGLGASGVDLIAKDLVTADDAVVTDVNPGTPVPQFLYPAYGKHRRVAVAMADQMVKSSGLY